MEEVEEEEGEVEEQEEEEEQEEIDWLFGTHEEGEEQVRGQ